MKIAGIYKITNIITGEFYIGSSKDIKHRWTQHRSPLSQKHLLNSKLYKDMAEFGLDNFKFEVLEETTDLRNREQYYIEQLKPSYNNYRAKGRNTERYKESNRRYQKEWCKSHRNERLTKTKAYYSRLCFYEGEILTLCALSARFTRQGIAYPCKEAKKYLL